MAATAWPKRVRQGRVRSPSRESFRAGQDPDPEGAEQPENRNGSAAAASQLGRAGRVSRTRAQITTSATVSATRSDSAVASTYVVSSAERELIMNVRTSSPARAGRKLLPKYPAAVAQNAAAMPTAPSALRRTRHRLARRKSVTVPRPPTSTRRPGAARATIRATCLHWIPRRE